MKRGLPAPRALLVNACRCCVFLGRAVDSRRPANRGVPHGAAWPVRARLAATGFSADDFAPARTLSAPKRPAQPWQQGNLPAKERVERPSWQQTFRRDQANRPGLHAGFWPLSKGARWPSGAGGAGREAAALEAIGAALGSLGLIAFGLLVWQMMGLSAFAAAILAWPIVSIAAWIIYKRR